MNEKSNERHVGNSKIYRIIGFLLFMLLFGGITHVKAETLGSQQTISVNGVVEDAIGDPIIGASIKVKGGSTGTITDIDGKFSLNVPVGTKLEISYLGHKTQEVLAAQNLKIKLQEDDQFLDELVVIGYGVQKKKLVTGATVQVKGEDIAKQNTPNVLTALQSQAPGVNITQISGFIGESPKVRIRGTGTVGDNTPLYVVDGVAGVDINGLSPSDIESIDILKDAATAAIYGSRAANGVILVTTKRGKDGRFDVTYDGYYGVQNVYKIPTILNAKEFMAMQDEALAMDGKPLTDWAKFVPKHDLDAINSGAWQGTNWLKELLNKDAVTHSHALNFTGGTERSVFSIGLSYLSQEATIGVPNAAPVMERYNARVNSDHVMMKKNGLDFLKVGQTLNYRFQESEGNVPRDDVYWNVVRDGIKTSPLMHAYNHKGDYYMYDDRIADGYSWDISGGGDRNPIAFLDYHANQNKSRSHFMNSSLYLDLQPIKNLHIRTQFGFMMGFSSYRAYTPAYGKMTETTTQLEDKVSQSMSNYHRWTWDNTASYNFKINAHNISLMLGQSVEKWGMGENLTGSNTNSNFYDFEYAYLGNVSGTTGATLGGVPNAPGAIASFFGRASYDYKEKYMATVILRADAASQFARGYRWGYFPSLSAGWVVTNEDFMEDKIDWLDFLKLRVSWGQNGNNRIPPFLYSSPIRSDNTIGGYPFGGSMDDAAIGSYGYRLVNPEASWETQEQINLGIDSWFLKNRLGLEFDVYSRKTKDWLVHVPVLASLGAEPVARNAGAVRNTGFELTLRWNETVNKDFSYGVSVGLGYNKNKVVEMKSEEGRMPGDQNVVWWGSAPFSIAEVGLPIGYFYGYKSNGIFQNQKQIDEYDGPLLLGDKTQPGDVIWADTDRNGVLDDKDRTKIGDPNPDFTMGLNFNISWKGIDLAVNTYSAFGHQIFKCYRDFVASPYNNFTTDILQRWHGEGTSNKLPRLASSSHTNWGQISDIYVEDADFMKIKNVTLGYDFKRLFSNIPLQQLKIYVSAQNLFTITGYSGMDPELGYGGTKGWASGVDLGTYPSARTFMVGANIKF